MIPSLKSAHHDLSGAVCRLSLRCVDMSGLVNNSFEKSCDGVLVFNNTSISHSRPVLEED